MVNYTGLTEAEVLLALYKNSSALGMGALHHRGNLTLEDVQADLDSMVDRGAFGIPAMDVPNGRGPARVSLDYYRGHPFKLTLDTEAKTFEERGFDRDAGTGAAQRAVDQALAAKK